MKEKNQQVLATAYKKAKSKIAKIKELGITPDMSQDDQDAIIKRLAEAKAIEENEPMTKFLHGQEWYVKSLVDFSGIEPAQQLDQEYEDCFADFSTEDEMTAKLAAMQA